MAFLTSVNENILDKRKIARYNVKSGNKPFVGRRARAESVGQGTVREKSWAVRTKMTRAKPFNSRSWNHPRRGGWNILVKGGSNWRERGVNEVLFVSQHNLVYVATPVIQKVLTHWMGEAELVEFVLWYFSVGVFISGDESLDCQPLDCGEKRKQCSVS